MKCPKCGYMRQARDDAFVPTTECPSCGIVYSKHDTVAAPARSTHSLAPSRHLRPSAVDPESLKKARERVEKRLRERMETRVRDDRHAQTLELAKKITSEGGHNFQNLIPPTIEERVEKTSAKAAGGAVEPPEDPLLLDEMIGVQIHSGKGDKTLTDKRGSKEKDDLPPEDSRVEARVESVPDDTEAEAPDPQTDVMEAEAHEPDPDAFENEPHASGLDAMEADTPVPEPPTEDDASYPDDVQVETILLTSRFEDADTPSEALSESEPPSSRETFVEGDDQLPEAYMDAASTATSYGARLTRLLPMVAWLVLVTGVVGAVLSWTTISDVEAGVTMPTSDSPATLLPIGLLLGFAYLATGALGFAFFWVSSMINGQLKDIQQILMAHPGPTIAEDIADSQPDGPA